MIDVRCVTHLHFRADVSDAARAGNAVFEIRCQWCKNKFQRLTVHRWTLDQIREAQTRGLDVAWPCLDPADDPAAQ